MACMKIKKLEEYLQGVESFEDPKILLEQYVTPAHIASCMIYTIQTQFEDIGNKLVADLGSGCGMLSIAAALLDASLVIGFEVDVAAIEVFSRNVADMELPNVDCVQTDVLELATEPGCWSNVFDTVVTNPPFGTKHNAGMDMKFLKKALQMSNQAVYSLHKTSTRDYILKKSKSWGVKGSVVAELRYNLDASYRFHKNQSRDIAVDFWRFDVTSKEI